MNVATNEAGELLICPICSYSGGMYWAEQDRVWYCPTCGSEMDRSAFFAFIDAHPAMAECRACTQNYPVCCDRCQLWQTQAPHETL